MNILSNITDTFTIVVTDRPEYISDNIKQYAKQHNYEFFSFGYKREDLNNIKEIYKGNTKVICFIKNIDKSLVSDALLRLCEAGREDFILVATYTMLKENCPLRSRARIIYDNNINNSDIVKLTIEYTRSKSKTILQNIFNMLCLSEKDQDGIYPLEYLKMLARYYAENITIVNANNIRTIAEVVNSYKLNPNNLFIKALLEDMLGELKC